MAFQVLKLFETVTDGSRSPPASGLLPQSSMPRRLPPLRQARLSLALGLQLMGAGSGRPAHDLLSSVYGGSSSH